MQTLAKNQRDLYGQFVSLTLLLVMTKSEENKMCIKNIKTFLSLLYKKIKVMEEDDELISVFGVR